MNTTHKLLAVLLALIFCLSVASCAPVEEPPAEEGPTTVTTLEETTPEETTPEETTPEVTEPDFSNTPDPDGTKRY